MLFKLNVFVFRFVASVLHQRVDLNGRVYVLLQQALVQARVFGEGHFALQWKMVVAQTTKPRAQCGGTQQNWPRRFLRIAVLVVGPIAAQ